MSKRLGGIIGCKKYKTSLMAFKLVPRWYVATLLGQRYNTGEKSSVMMYTYINRHAGTPDKKSKTNVLSLQPTTPTTKRFDIFPPVCVGCSEV